ncbi:MAG TPA: enoyl-CoA hydratase/isomerase family protein [Candidatus Acidoferrales bacterium]|nr:enoyl-CoA hydratase/isomerase family protein [Candidatus Acidoferrales bacterium]
MPNDLILANISEEQGIAWLTLNRPEKKNALSTALLRELGDLLRSIRENDKIRCVVTTGAGDSYSSGRDIREMRDQYGHRRRWFEFEGVAEIVVIMRSMPQITVAAVRGYCLGGGLALVNGHELAIAADTAKFGMPEILRGSYGATATPTLFHSGVSLKKSFYIQLTGRHLSGEEAERAGLVSKAVPEKDLTSFVEELAREIASRNPISLEHAKIAGYTLKDLDFQTAIRADDLVAHRMRYYTNPLSDVDNYLQSQKGGGNVGYTKPERKG